MKCQSKLATLQTRRQEKRDVLERVCQLTTFFCSLLFCSVDCSYSRGTMFSRVPHNWMLFRSINQKKCYQLVILDFHCFANRKKAKVENTGNSKHSVRFLTFFFFNFRNNFSNESSRSDTTHFSHPTSKMPSKKNFCNIFVLLLRKHYFFSIYVTALKSILPKREVVMPYKKKTCRKKRYH